MKKRVMWKSSTELLDYALRELQAAVSTNTAKTEIEIVLIESSNGDMDEIANISKSLELKTITEMFREEFYNYDIKSIVSKKGRFNIILTYKNAPCHVFYPLVWTLTLRKKS